jgi:hypothetical protein
MRSLLVRTAVYIAQIFLCAIAIQAATRLIQKILDYRLRRLRRLVRVQIIMTTPELSSNDTI